MTRALYLNTAVQFLGLSVREALILPVGLVVDMRNLEVHRCGLDKEK